MPCFSQLGPAAQRVVILNEGADEGAPMPPLVKSNNKFYINAGLCTRLENVPKGIHTKLPTDFPLGQAAGSGLQGALGRT